MNDIDRQNYWFKDEDICRICLDTEDKEDLVRVCRCKGSAKYAHKSCILRWFQFSCRYECQLCHYKMKIKKDGFKPVREVSIVGLWFKRRFFSLIIKYFIFKCKFKEFDAIKNFARQFGLNPGWTPFKIYADTNLFCFFLFGIRNSGAKVGANLMYLFYWTGAYSGARSVLTKHWSNFCFHKPLTNHLLLLFESIV